MAEAQQASLAINHLDKTKLWGKVIRVMLSKHSNVQVSPLNLHNLEEEVRINLILVSAAQGWSAGRWTDQRLRQLRAAPVQEARQ